MGKVIKAAAMAFAITFIAVGLTAVLTNSALVAAEGFKAAFLAGLGGTSTLALATLSGVSTLVMGLMSKGAPSVTGNFGTKVSGRAATAPRQIIYGQCRVGGTVTHIQTSGVDNNTLTQVIVIAGHEVEELVNVRINDTNLTTQSSGGWQYATNSRYRNSDNDNAFSVQDSLIRFRFLDGSQTSSDSTITSATSLTTTDKFTGLAYICIQMIFDAEKFSGQPAVSFLVKGKKVYDPRDSSQSSSDSSTWQWSQNPALIIRDYLADTTYGLKATDDEILDSSTLLGGIGSAANTCDIAVATVDRNVNGNVSNSTVVNLVSGTNVTLISAGDTVTGNGISGTVKVVSRNGVRVVLDTAVTLTSGTTLSFGQPQYTANGFANMSGTGKGILEGLLSSCAGKISYINGKFIVFAGATVTPEMTITDDSFLAPATIKTKSSGADHYNSVKSVYVASTQNYIAMDTPVYTDSTLLSNDTPSGEASANYRKLLELQLPFTDSVAMAERLGKINLLHSRQQMVLSCVVDISFLQLQPFDWVYVTNSRMGFTNKKFEVLAMNLQPMGDDAPVLGVKLELKEIDGAVYNFVASDYEAPTDETDADDTNDLSVTAPTNLGATQQAVAEGAGFKADIKVSWTNNTSQRVNGTEIQYKLSTDSDYTGDIQVARAVSNAIIPNAVIGKTYNIRAAHSDINGVKSAYTDAVNITITDPNASINAPSSLTATGNKAGILLQWTNPDVSNLRSIKIYRHTSVWSPTNDTYLRATVAGEPNKIMTFFQGYMDGLQPDTTYYFTVRAITNNGVHSSFATMVSASFSAFIGDDVGLSNLGDLDSTANTKLSGIEANATVGATFGTDFFDTDGSTALTAAEMKNAQITLNADGSLANIGSSQILSNASIAQGDLVGSGKTFSVKPNKTTFADGSTEGAFNFTLDDGSATGVNVFSSAERTKLDRLRLGQDPADATRSIQNNDISINASGQLAGIGTGNNSIVNNANIVESDIVGSGKTFAAGQKPNKTTFADNSTEGVFTLGADGTDSTVNVFSSAERTKLNRLRLGQDPSDATKSIKNTSITLNSDGSLASIGTTQILSNAKIAEADIVGSGKTFTVKPNKTEFGDVSGTEGVFGFKTDGAASFTNVNVFSSAERTKLNRLRAGQNPNNASQSIINNDLSLSLDGTSLTLSGGGGSAQTLDKGSVGLSDLNSLDSTANTKLGGIEANATVGATFGTDFFDTDGSTALTAAQMKNAQITLNTDGSLDNIGTTQILSNAKIAEADIVGSGKTFSVKPNKTVLADGSTEGILTVATDGGSAVTVNVFSSAERTKLDRLRAGQNPANASQSIVNNDLSLSLDGTSLSLSGGGGSAQTLSKASVGLSDLASLDSTAGTKLGGIEAGATVGATLDDNLVDEFGNDLNSSDLVTSQGTANDTSNVSGTAAATVKNNAAVGNTSASNLQSTINSLNDPSSSLAITGERITGGVIEGSLIKTDELALATKGTAATGTSIVVNTTTDSSDYIADLGTGAGMYFGGITFEVDSGTNIYQGSVHLDIREGSGSVNVFEKYFPKMMQAGAVVYDHNNAYTRFERAMHMEFMFFYSGTQTLKAYLTARASASTGANCTVTLRVAKFAAEGVNQFTFTDETGLTKATNNTTYEESNAVTIAGFSGTQTASVSGHSSAEFKVNSGSFSSSNKDVVPNDTVTVRILVPQTDATTRSATLNVGGVADTYSITTSGSYVPDPDDSFNCFAAGTLIWLGDLNYKPIEEVVVGDVVMSFNQDTLAYEPKAVEYVMTPRMGKIYEFSFNETDDTLRMTDAHPILGEDGEWYALDPEKALEEHKVECLQLERGTELLHYEMQSVTLWNIELVGEQETYNLSEIKDNHTFVADGFIAHNVGQEIKP